MSRLAMSQMERDKRVELLIPPRPDTIESIELDYRLLIVGDFSKKVAGAQGHLKDRQLHEIKSKRDFKIALEALNPRLNLSVPNRLSDDPGAKMEISLEVKDLKDFHPDMICQKVAPLQDLMQARARLKNLKTAVLKDPNLRKAIEMSLQKGSGSEDELSALTGGSRALNLEQKKPAEQHSTREPRTAASPAVEVLMSMLDHEQKDMAQEFISRIGKEHEVFRVNATLLDSYIADIDKVISAQMDEILHHKDFQELESAWRGLHFLVQHAEFDKPVKFTILDCSKEELYRDLEPLAPREPTQHTLYEHVYWNAYHKAGCHPYSAIIADYRFDNSNQDLKLLQELAILGECAQLPVIGNVSAAFFGHESMNGVMSNRSLAERLNNAPEYAAWRELREEERSKYLGLCLPRFRGRLPYGPEGEPTKDFNYTEAMYREGEEQSLWCKASYALASNMVRNFDEWGWHVKMAGLNSGGRVENLPVLSYEENGQQKLRPPLEALVGQIKETELCELGFIPLAHLEKTDSACFFEMRSVHRPQKVQDDPAAALSNAFGARLQYTMLVTRLAHYLKYRHLCFVSKDAGPSEIQQDLSAWLDSLVAEDSNRLDVLKPLQSYRLEVTELEERPGFYQIAASIRPHVAIIGMNVDLQLLAYQ